MISQAARRRHDHMRLVGQLQGLAHHVCHNNTGEMFVPLTHTVLKPRHRGVCVVTHATDNDAVLQTQRLPQDSKLLSDLIGQLPA